MPELEPKDFKAVLDYLPVGLKVQMQMNPRKTYLAGGFIREIAAGNKPRDIDIFVPNDDTAHTLSAEYAQNYPGEHKLWRSEFAYNFEAKGQTPIQWVFAVRFDPTWSGDCHYEILNSFDFSMSKAVLWWAGEWYSEVDEQFYPAIAERKLIFQPSSRDRGNLRALKRVIKFAARGWKIDDDNLATIIHYFDTSKPKDKVKAALNPLYGQAAQTNAGANPAAGVSLGEAVARLGDAIEGIGSFTGRLNSSGPNTTVVSTPTGRNRWYQEYQATPFGLNPSGEVQADVTFTDSDGAFFWREITSGSETTRLVGNNPEDAQEQ